MSRYLNASQAATKMGLSPRTVSDLCRTGSLEGTYKEHNNGPWLIPEESIDSWLSRNRSSTGRIANKSGLPPWVRKITVGAIVAVLALILALVSATADWPAAWKTILNWGYDLGMITPYDEAENDETLIIVSTIYVPDGVIDTAAHNEMKRGIEGVAKELDHTNVRVEIDPRIIEDYDQERAAQIAERADASMIIWGSDTGVRISLKFLSLKEASDRYRSAHLSEVHRTQLADQVAYAEFITNLLPSSTRSLALYSIVQSHSFGGNTDAELEALELAAELSFQDLDAEGQAVLHNQLGNLYAELFEYRKAIEAYSRGIEIDPDNATIYTNRAAARADSGDYAGAIEDHNVSIDLDPDYSRYFARGTTYLGMEENAAAVSDFDIVLALEPRYAAAYINRGNAYMNLGDLDAAVVNYNEVIDRYDGLDVAAVAYNNRAAVAHTQGNLDKAIADMGKALEIDPDDLSSRLVRGVWHEKNGDPEAALSDFRIYLTFAPDNIDTSDVQDLINELELDLQTQ